MTEAAERPAPGPVRMTLGVGGMHCANCEVLIENTLLQLPGVHDVRVSLRKRQVTVGHDEAVTLEVIETALAEIEYTVGDAAALSDSDELRWDTALIALAGLFLVGGYILLGSFGFLPGDVAIPDNLSYGVAFLIGLVASVSTCMAVAGGLLVAFLAGPGHPRPDMSAAARFKPHLYFNAGRIMSYTGFGAAIGALGSAFALSTGANAVLVLVAALVMILLGLQMLNAFPSLHWLVPAMPKWVSRSMQPEKRKVSRAGAFLLGASTFFLPCGFTQALQLYVLAKGSAALGAGVMLAFALGTLPALLSLSTVTTLAKGAFRRRFTRFAGAAVVLVGALSMHSAWTLFVTSGVVSVPRSDEAAVPLAPLVDGKQVVRMSVVGLDYHPNVFRVRAGTPVEWRIESAYARGCARMLIAPGLGVRTILSADRADTISFMPDQPGEYAFNCGMGMMPASSRFIVEPKAS